MNPYDDNVPYDFIMPYNGVTIVPPDQGGGHHGGKEKRVRYNDMAVIWSALDILFDDDGK